MIRQDTTHVAKLLEKWGGWKIEDELGHGSFGTVYKVSRMVMGEPEYAAVKHMEIPRTPYEVDSLYSEGKVTNEESVYAYYTDILRKLTSEINLMRQFVGYTNFVAYMDSMYIAKADEPGYDVLIRMELLTSLTKRLAEMDNREVARMGIDICEALTILNEKNIIHRDIKPGNIMINSSGNYKLGDFGVARTMEGMASHMTIAGTPDYMAPELHFGRNVDATADQYSLGLVMYRLLNGMQPPFCHATPIPSSDEKDAATVSRFRGDPLPPPDYCDDALARIILRACSYRPEDRYPSPAVMRAELKQYLRQIPEPVTLYDPKDNPVPAEPPVFAPPGQTGPTRDGPTIYEPQGYAGPAQDGPTVYDPQE